MTERQGFLARWSKTKRAKEVAPRPEAAPAPTEDEPFDLASLPALEDLTGESEVSAFLNKAVPEALRNAALRKVWSADPFIRDHIGPADYAWDFNDPDAMPGFGPIDPETDVAALLRRIVGEPEPETEVSQAPPLALEPEAQPEQEAQDGAEITPPAPLSSSLEAPQENNPPPPRRRHGGAVPG